MYKDKERRKQASKERMRQYRAKKKGVTESGCNRQGVTCFEDLPADVQQTIDHMASSPEDRQARIERAIRYQQMYPSPYARGISHGPIDLPEGYKTADQLNPGEYNRVSKPGDPDYEHGAGQCKTCGVPTPIEAITKCKGCIEAIDKASEALSATPEPVEAA